ncbi:restriction endonuclease subunit S [Flavobacterium haoranii]|uniref:Type I restriction modification DNA specificity domain-containing protein n=2 Tax=Flavobacterium haoranii TaxID=683124 RepID=A0A1M6LSZ7_9FLAO|nr:restriction endonuclease subunit S [Flavobacterium haoranii]SHJ74206.1 Type I restriction modification DNA specificity domain-containing protein [Flavobacterium haoranii]
MKSNWKIKTVGEICEFINGKGHEKIIDENGKYIVVNSKFVSSNGKIYKKSNSQLLPLFKNDIVLVMSDVPNGKTLAKCFKIDEDNKYTLNQRVCALRTNDLDLDFFLIQINRNQYFLNFDNGENQTNLRKNDILECPIFIPPIDEQLAIVSKLNQTLGFIEQSNSILEKNLSNLEELKKSILEKAFKGELV